MLNFALSDSEMLAFLLNEFCTCAYEIEQMKKWIEIKGVEYVYKTVKKEIIPH